MSNSTLKSSTLTKKELMNKTLMNKALRRNTLKNALRTISNSLPYVEVSRGGYGRFRGVSLACGVHRSVRAEIHIYKREFNRYGLRGLFGGYTNVVKLG